MPVNVLADPPKTASEGIGKNTYRTDQIRIGITIRVNLCLRKSPVALSA